MNFSIILCIWKRSECLLNNALLCWAVQTLMPHEVIVVDGNPDAQESKKVQEVCARYSFVRWLHYPLASFNSPKLINYGIRNISAESEYIFTADMEMMFSLNYLECLSGYMDDSVLGCGCCGTLPPNAIVPEDPVAGWKSLMEQVDPGSATQFSPGTFVCAHRDWWYKIRGYDEQLFYAWVDSDLHRRAHLDGRRRVIVSWPQAQAIHQWHPPSALFYAPGGRLLRTVQRDMTVVRNPRIWGGLP